MEKQHPQLTHEQLEALESFGDCLKTAIAVAVGLAALGVLLLIK